MFLAEFVKGALDIFMQVEKSSFESRTDPEHEVSAVLVVMLEVSIGSENWTMISELRLTEVALSFGVVERTEGGVESVVLKDQLLLFLSRGLPDSSVIDPYSKITVWVIPEASEEDGVKVAFLLEAL